MKKNKQISKQMLKVWNELSKYKLECSHDFKRLILNSGIKIFGLIPIINIREEKIICSKCGNELKLWK